MMITGASSGIGEAAARLAVKRGYRVALAARRKEKLHRLADELGAGHAVAIGCDVTSYDSCVEAVETCVAAFGQLNVLFANAGVGRSVSGWLVEPVSDWYDQVTVNILGAAYASRAALPALMETRGHIVFTGSTSARRPLAGSIYGCSKVAVGAMAEALRLEVAGSGVHVSIVNPGFTDTPIHGSKDIPDWALTPEDVAAAVLYIVGQPDHVDINEILIRPVNQRN